MALVTPERFSVSTVTPVWPAICAKVKASASGATCVRMSSAPASIEHAGDARALVYLVDDGNVVLCECDAVGHGPASHFSSLSSRPASLRQRLMVLPSSELVPALGSPVLSPCALAGAPANSQDSASLSLSMSFSCSPRIARAAFTFAGFSLPMPAQPFAEKVGRVTVFSGGFYGW